MKIIVVIGGIGSGKSTVSGTFRDLGAAFIDLDVVPGSFDDARKYERSRYGIAGSIYVRAFPVDAGAAKP